jgi:hypothetical protein
MTDPTEIAKGLTRPQRLFLSGELDGATLISPTGWGGGIRSVAARIVSKGLANKFWSVGRFYYSELTPLGLSVRAVLQEKG